MSNILEDIAGAGDLSDFAPGLGTGEHVVCLSKIETRDSREYGKKIDIEYVIVESTAHPKGETRGDVFFIQRNGDAGSYARKRANAFSREVVKSLGGDPDDATLVNVNGKQMPKGQAMVVQTLGKLLDKAQPGRGILLKVSTRKRPNKDKSKEYDNNTYTSVTQTKEEIGKRRQALDTAGAAAAAAQAAAAAAQAPAPQPAQPEPTSATSAYNLDGLL